MIENIRERLNSDERAVSPVIGVILMVAITVILAAVIGTFVLGLTDEVGQSAPQASLSVHDTDTSNNNITLRHGGGDTIEADETTIVVENDTATTRFAASDMESDGAPIASGDRLRISVGDDDGDPNDDIIEVIGQEDPWATEGSANPHDFTNVTVDDRVTVTVIDRPSGEIIFDREFRV